MSDAQVLAAIAVRVDAELEPFYAGVRELKAAAAGVEASVKIRIPVSLVGLSEVRAQIAELQRMAQQVGGGGAAVATGGGRTAVASAPSYTVDGRNFLLNNPNLAGGAGGGRLSATPGGFATPVAAIPVPIQPVAPAVARNAVAQTLNVMRGAAAQMGPITVPVQAVPATPGSPAARSPGGGGRFQPFGPSISGHGSLLSTLPMYALMAAAGMQNASMDLQRDMSLSTSFQQQAMAEMNFQRARSTAIPFVGGAGFEIRNAMNGWMGGPTTQGIETTLGQAGQQRSFSDAQRGGQWRAEDINRKIAIVATGFDTIARSEQEIADNLKKTKRATQVQFEKDMESIGAELGLDDVTRMQRRNFLLAGKQKADLDSERMADAERQRVTEQTGVTRFDLRTRQLVADVQRNATGLDSDHFLGRYSSILGRGRELQKEVGLAPAVLREATRTAAVAEMEAVRADLTRVGSRTYAQQFDSGFQSIEALKATGGTVEELQKLVSLTNQQIALLQSIADKQAVIGE